jgi:hypothetical protein
MSPEGVVLGADSTASLSMPPNGFHYLNHNQKLFELGEESTLGVLTWGLAGLGDQSYRTLLALLADNLRTQPPTSVLDVATRWSQQFWAAYTTSPATVPAIQACQALSTKAQHDPAAPPNPNMRSVDEEALFNHLKMALVVGFCIGGHLPANRQPDAYELIFDPLAGQPSPAQIPQLNHRFWGAPNIINRLIGGADSELRNLILTSGHWNGSDKDLDSLLRQLVLSHPILPIRDAIDFVHTCILSTIKAMKFSNLSQICGGPIEIAVITTDRKFRWVRHKAWDAAILEGELL